MMKFYTQQHQFYCGVDLHAKSLHACVVDAQGKRLLHKNFLCQKPQVFLNAIAPYKSDLIIGCESTFNWYWLADLLCDEGIPFILGHALYMKAIHGGKTKSDAIDSEKIARLIRGGNFPLAHVYPKEHRASRDLMRRRTFLVRRRAEALTHIQMVHHQHNLPKPTNIKYKANRNGVGDDLPNPHARLMIDVDFKLLEAYDIQISRLELELTKSAKITHPQIFYRLQTVPGIGPVLALTIMHEIESIDRFPSVGNFLSYSRLVKGNHTSAGKNYGSPGAKMGNAYLRWAFGEAISILKRESSEVRTLAERLEKKHGAARAMNTLAVKLGRAIYYMLRDDRAFDVLHFIR
jgi:transposase